MVAYCWSTCLHLYVQWDGFVFFVMLTDRVLVNWRCQVLQCSTIWVARQSRWFLCLFWRETRQRILGPEISPYPEVVRGREWELAGQRSWQELATGQQTELAWKHGQRQLTPDSGDSSREDRVQRRRSSQKMLAFQCLWNFR